MAQAQSPSDQSTASSAVSVISERTKAIRAQYYFERRLLFLCTFLVAIAIVLWLTSISTDFWFIIRANSTHGIWINQTSRYFLRSNSGLFKICRETLGNMTAGAKTTPKPVEADGKEETTQSVNSTGTLKLYSICKYHEVFPSEEKVRGDPMLDMTILNYTRTEIMFSIISLCVMIMGLCFSVYTFNNPRYTFKRLAGGIHFISCLSIFVVIEILMQSIDYEKAYLPVVHPRNTEVYYHYSYWLAWVVFLLNFVAGVSFMWYSKKRKGDRAPNEEVAMANEPTIIGR